MSGTMQCCDVLILGGGVAGSATALALRQHRPDLSVIIVERGVYGETRMGETLPPQALSLLQQLGLWERFQQQDFAPAAGTCAAWDSPDLYHNDYMFSPMGPGWHLDRAAFDRWMACEAEATGAMLLTETRVITADRMRKGWLVEMTQAAARWKVQAQFVVDATGRAAAFARRQGTRRQPLDRLVALYRFFPALSAPRNAYTLIEAMPEGWWYSAYLPGRQRVIALMTDADLARKYDLRRGWTARLHATRHTQARFPQVTGESPQTVAVHTQRLDAFVGHRWLAVGDAATTFDPLSSLGMLKALRTSFCAAYAVGDCLKGDTHALKRYEKLLAGEYRAYLAKRQAHYSQVQRWPEAPFWARRHAGLEHLTEPALKA